MVPYLCALEQKSVKVPSMSPVGSDEEDLTRKQRREQARADRKAMEEAAAAGAARRTRLTQLGLVVAVVVVAVVVILIATGVGSSGATSTQKKVAALLGGIPQSGNTLGSPTAPVTLQYFGDLECPICQKFTLGALPTVIQKWVRTGKLRIEYRSLETATREPETFKLQQVAAYAAGKQNKAWYFIETFYHEQGEEDTGYVTEKYIQGIASQVPGLDLATWSADRGDAQLANQIVTDAQAANNNGFTGTPSFLIGRSGGAMSKLEYTNGPEDPTFVNEAVEKLLKA
jgi:protein-disulfide isomerase